MVRRQHHDDGRVIALDLNFNGLSGEIPAELGSLSNLRELYLHSNDLSGEIPVELGSLSNLESLRLGGNSLSGCVPSSLEDQLNFDASYLGDLPFCGTGPDRTASTPTETPASPTRTASTPVPSPTATDAPGTAAATAPPAVSGSAETDREALVAPYNATNGENWFRSDNWLSDAPLGEWYGVVTNDDGRVTALDLNNNALRSGEIPAELGTVTPTYATPEAVERVMGSNSEDGEGPFDALEGG